MWFTKLNSKDSSLISRNLTGFTILELSIVIVILTIISSLMFVSFNTARQINRDTKRVADIHAMQSALALYYRDWSRYPATSEVTGGVAFASGTVTYLSPWPQNPSPRDDGSCLDTDYLYMAVASQSSYSIQFCLGAANADVGPGASYAIPDEIITCLPNCVLSCGAGDDGCGGTCANIASCATGYTCVSYHCQKN